MDFKDQVYDVISTTFLVDKSVVNDELSIGDIPKWDSVGNVILVKALECAFEVEIPIEDLFELTNVASIVEEINKLKNE